ncbi:MAG: hypothetical protein DMF81_13980 [Acidobacteria bacterium]|nr:MAG: hypothetical protein DMF81_13980 [Acidobacteriota bacterium]
MKVALYFFTRAASGYLRTGASRPGSRSVPSASVRIRASLRIRSASGRSSLCSASTSRPMTRNLTLTRCSRTHR